mgnify:CR=1 FL=1
MFSEYIVRRAKNELISGVSRRSPKILDIIIDNLNSGYRHFNKAGGKYE